MESKFDSKEYKRSRGAYMAQCTFEYFVSILVADAFLAKLLTTIGISDAIIGIISSLVTFAFLFQLLSLWIVTRIKDTKKTVIIFDTVSQLFFLAIYLIPFSPLGVKMNTALVVVSIITAYIFKYTIASVMFKWANSYVDPCNRGRYSAVKEMISLFTGIIFTLTIGYIIDRHEAIGDIKGGFLFIAISIFILNCCNFISLLLIKKDYAEERGADRKPIKDVLKNTVGNKNFVNVIIMTSMYEMARYMTVGFLGVFKTKDLLISVGTVQIINMVGNLFRLAVSLPFGKYTDKHSYSNGYALALMLAAAAFGANIFTTNSTKWGIVIYTIFFNMSMAGTNQNTHNITYSYVNKDYIVQAMAIRGCIAGLFGFGASLIGSRILQFVQDNGNSFFGIPMYGQQLLSAISVVILIGTIIFNKKVVGKQKVMIQ